jgi:putative zinc finger/helix-turn-helix YgiT family protein
MNREYGVKTNRGARCECCSTGQLETRFRKETIEHSAEEGTISIPANRVPVSVCNTCGSVYVTAETARIRHEYICRALGIITPAEIRQIRDRHGLSQAELSRITDFGEASISRWERGRLLPNRSNSRFLKLLLQHPHVVELLIKLETESRAEVQEPAAAAGTPDWVNRFSHIPREDVGRASQMANRFSLVGG